MRALLDVNVLVALFDEEHPFFSSAHRWMETECHYGWASNALTENGLMRVLSNPNYSKILRISPTTVIHKLNRFINATDHEFWPNDLSLRDQNIFDVGQILGSRQISDLYLLGLAVKHQGRLVTFDTTIYRNAVPAAQPAHLCVIT
ncbi:MAG: PIN domain-containing protein [Blastochloris sp.]|nr:PIN domain-containing protein [Blastochloris sp.]